MGGLYGQFLSLGINGIWNDMNEPAVFNVDAKTMPRSNRHRADPDLPDLNLREGAILPLGPMVGRQDTFMKTMVTTVVDGDWEKGTWRLVVRDISQ